MSSKEPKSSETEDDGSIIEEMVDTAKVKGKNILLKIGKFLLYLFIIIPLYPFIWLILKQPYKYVKFYRKDSDKGIDTSGREYVQSVPITYIVLGLFVGSLIALFAAKNLREGFSDYVADISVVKFMGTIGEVIWLFFSGIWWVLSWIGRGIINVIIWTAEWIFTNPVAFLFIMLFVSLFLGVPFLFAYFFFDKEKTKLWFGGKIRWIFRLPYRVWNWLDNEGYDRINYWIGCKVYGKKRLHNRTHRWWKIMLSLSLVTFALFIATVGIYGATTIDFSSDDEMVSSSIFLILLVTCAGLLGGILTPAVYARLFDVMAKRTDKAEDFVSDMDEEERFDKESAESIEAREQIREEKRNAKDEERRLRKEAKASTEEKSKADD